MSVNRAEYSVPESVLSEKRTRVGSLAQQNFPPPIELNAVTWEFIAVDLPFEGNDAHAEVRPHQVGDASRDARKPNSRPAKERLRARLAAVMLVLPTTALGPATSATVAAPIPPPTPIPETPTVGPNVPRLPTAVRVLLSLMLLVTLFLVMYLLWRCPCS